MLIEKIKRNKYITAIWLSSVFLSPADRSSLDYGWITRTKSIKLNGSMGHTQSPQSIDIIQAEKKYDEGDFDKDEGITF